jgi:hypothetical protein
MLGLQAPLDQVEGDVVGQQRSNAPGPAKTASRSGGPPQRRVKIAVRAAADG